MGGRQTKRPKILKLPSCLKTPKHEDILDSAWKNDPVYRDPESETLTGSDVIHCSATDTRPPLAHSAEGQTDETCKKTVLAEPVCMNTPDDHYDRIHDSSLNSETEVKSNTTPEMTVKHTSRTRYQRISALTHTGTPFDSRRIQIFKPLLLATVKVQHLIPYLSPLTEVKKIQAIAARDARLALLYLLDDITTPRNTTDDKCSPFLDALKKCGYPYVVDVLERRDPIDHNYQRDYLRTVSPILRHIIKSTQLVALLWAPDVISTENKDNIIETDRSKGSVLAADMLLRVLPDRHPHWYWHFVDALEKTNCTLAMEILNIDELRRTAVFPENDLEETGRQGTRSLSLQPNTTDCEDDKRTLMNKHHEADLTLQYLKETQTSTDGPPEIFPSFESPDISDRYFEKYEPPIPTTAAPNPYIDLPNSNVHPPKPHETQDQPIVTITNIERERKPIPAPRRQETIMQVVSSTTYHEPASDNEVDHQMHDEDVDTPKTEDIQLNDCHDFSTVTPARSDSGRISKTGSLNGDRETGETVQFTTQRSKPKTSQDMKSDEYQMTGTVLNKTDIKPHKVKLTGLRKKKRRKMICRKMLKNRQKSFLNPCRLTDEDIKQDKPLVFRKRMPTPKPKIRSKAVWTVPKLPTCTENESKLDVSKAEMLSYSEPFRCQRGKDDEDIFTSFANPILQEQVCQCRNTIHTDHLGNFNTVSSDKEAKDTQILEILRSCEEDTELTRNPSQIPVRPEILEPNLRSELEQLRDLENIRCNLVQRDKVMSRRLQVQEAVNDLLKRIRGVSSQLYLREKEAAALQEAITTGRGETDEMQQYKNEDDVTSAHANMSLDIESTLKADSALKAMDNREEIAYKDSAFYSQ